MRLCLLLPCLFLLSSCTLWSSRTDVTRDVNMVSEETAVREEFHDGQIIPLKTTTYKTTVTKEVAQIKSRIESPIISNGFNLTSLLSGGGAVTLLLGLGAKKLRDMPPKPKPQPERVKARKEDDDAT
jgi:hypothetical protein